MGRKIALVLVALAVSAGAVHSQEQTGSDTEPEDYSEEEFAPFLRDLRRAEIVMLGAFPLTLFLSLEAYDIYRFAASGGASEYAPWPFRPPGAVGYTGRENLGIFLAALSTSVLIAAADYMVNRLKAKRELE